MVLTNLQEKVGEVDVHFFLFFSDDTQQDSYFVAAGKDYIYSEFLPSIFPDDVTVKVYYESDGAGCYNSYVSKALMPWWRHFTNGRVEEVQIRHSIAGDGKSPLDAAFRKLGQNFRDAVNNGIAYITNATICLVAYQDGAGIGGATAAVLTLERDGHNLDVPTKNNQQKLLSSHRLVLDRSKNCIRGYSNSGYGEGIALKLDKINAMFPGEPMKPLYSMAAQVESLKSMDMSSLPTDSHQTRIKQTNLSKRDATEKALLVKHKSKIETAAKNKVYYYDVRRDIDGASCNHKCQSLEAHRKHNDFGKHSYPALNMQDYATSLSSGLDGMLRVGARNNRSEAYANVDVVDGKGTGVFDGIDWCGEGCYRKKPRAKAKKMDTALKDILIRMYNDGESSDGAMGGRNKYTPQKARDELKDMKLPSGLMMFSSTSIHGQLSSIQQIRSFWSRHRTALAKKKAGRLESTDDHDELDEWRNDALGNCAIGSDTCSGDGVSSAPKRTDKGQSKVSSMVLDGIHFVLDGDFREVEGGIDTVKTEIVNNGGVAGVKISKNTSE